MTGWPFPGDSPTSIARRALQAYRVALAERDPAECEAIDQRMISFGQRWVAAGVATHDLDDWLGPADAAALAEVPVAYLRMWRKRQMIAGRRTERGWEYQVREVLETMSRRGNRRSWRTEQP